LRETYTLKAANAISDSGGTDWTLAASTTTNTYAIAGQFSTAAPANTLAAWDSTDYMTTSAQNCSATQFGNGNAGESGLSVSPSAGSNTRNLWFRIHTPSEVDDAGGHTALVTLAVQ